jgi:hypothetical protein
MDLLFRTMLCVLIAMTLPALALADEQLDQAAVENLISSNTVEGKKLKWGTTYRTYFDPSGKFHRIDSLNNKEGGEWYIQDNGRLCMVGRKERCRIIKQRNDGGYDVFNRQGQQIWTIDKVIPGYPYDLKPKTFSE